MYIEKIIIENFKGYKGRFSLDLWNGPNIIVGNNEAGKSTILEAIHLGLSGFLNGRYLKNELSQYLFNRDYEEEYIKSLKSKNPSPPPHILIELYLNADELQELRGNGNSQKSDSIGVSFSIEFDEEYRSEYSNLVDSGEILSIPIEYYKVTWKSFARGTVSARSIPLKSILIDSSNSRLSYGSDILVSRIVKGNLEDADRVAISQAHRQMKEKFMEDPSVIDINSKLNSEANVSGKKIQISVDLSTQNAWETSLITYLDNIPFQYIGKGEQCVIKTKLALSQKKSREANVVLLEEPENHLSHANLSKLINEIISNVEGKQLIISTHSSYVANKLGLDNLILMKGLKHLRIADLEEDTSEFFKKLPGYDTLRLLLCDKAILVEGPSDELVVQKAYMKDNDGNLPIDHGIDVISVGTSFLRFLEISKKVGQKVAVVTDNDGDLNQIKKKYERYLGENKVNDISICFDSEVDGGKIDNFNYNTLEPKLLKCNTLKKLNEIFQTSFTNDEGILLYMRSNKTDCALSIFNFEGQIDFPKYIAEAIS
ncbi:MAG TPA: ATP-dependent endonuclease [Cytophagales bacterium]|nr:ATP-dependent endonuclease [Cytophagales bacterium]HAA23371.1 ATP-dependent endonuclease [Cytophagales bacterium]HAP63683.1 ATP-dependent endonuclease [Cytophagales bacterium]